VILARISFVDKDNSTGRAAVVANDCSFVVRSLFVHCLSGMVIGNEIFILILADQIIKSPEVPRSATPSREPLRTMYNPQVYALIKSNDWDYLFLQDRQSRFTMSRGVFPGDSNIIEGHLKIRDRGMSETIKFVKQ